MGFEPAERRLRIATHLNALQNQRLAEHPSRPEIVELDTNQVWDVPEGIEVIISYQKGWSNAPAEPPARWPASLKWFQLTSAGVDALPEWLFDRCTVTRGGGIQAPAIGEYVLGAIFAHEKKFWDIRIRSAEDWRHSMLGGVAGKRVGLAGFGHIGKEIARRCLAMDMQVAALSRSKPIDMEGVARAADFDALCADSDHLVLALPLTPETSRILGPAQLGRARPGLHVVNISRGGLIDDTALLAALDGGRIAAATLDVTEPEPLPAGHRFYTHDRIRLTAHVCGMSEDNEDRVTRKLFSNIERYLANKPLEDRVPSKTGY